MNHRLICYESRRYSRRNGSNARIFLPTKFALLLLSRSKNYQTRWLIYFAFRLWANNRDTSFVTTPVVLDWLHFWWARSHTTASSLSKETPASLTERRNGSTYCLIFVSTLRHVQPRLPQFFFETRSADKLWFSCRNDSGRVFLQNLGQEYGKKSQRQRSSKQNLVLKCIRFAENGSQLSMQLSIFPCRNWHQALVYTLISSN